MKRLSLLTVALMSLITACGPGEQGPEGDPGPGVNSAVAYICSGFADASGTGLGLYVTHAAWVFPDGGVMTLCAGEGNATQSSTFLMFRQTDKGAATASCAFTFDLGGGANGGAWSFAMNAARTSTAITYKDVGHPASGRVFTIPCTKT